ncbi:protein HokA [Serratia proteamaculans]|nr:protein HokA [Serratia proteamaculans]
MHQHQHGSLLTAEMQRRADMSRKLFLPGFTVGCVTFLVFIWLIRGSVCELTFKQGNTEVAAVLSCNVQR